MATLPMAFHHCLEKNLLEMALFSEKYTKNFGGNAIGNVANKKSTTLPSTDDSSLCLPKKSAMSQNKTFLLLVGTFLSKKVLSIFKYFWKLIYMFALEELLWFNDLEKHK